MTDAEVAAAQNRNYIAWPAPGAPPIRLGDEDDYDDVDETPHLNPRMMDFGGGIPMTPAELAESERRNRYTTSDLVLSQLRNSSAASMRY